MWFLDELSQLTSHIQQRRKAVVAVAAVRQCPVTGRRTVWDCMPHLEQIEQVRVVHGSHQLLHLHLSVALGSLATSRGILYLPQPSRPSLFVDVNWRHADSQLDHPASLRPPRCQPGLQPTPWLSYVRPGPRHPLPLAPDPPPPLCQGRWLVGAPQNPGAATLLGAARRPGHTASTSGQLVCPCTALRASIHAGGAGAKGRRDGHAATRVSTAEAEDRQQAACRSLGLGGGRPCTMEDPNNRPPNGGGIGPSPSGGGKASAQQSPAQQVQEVMNIFGADAPLAGMILVLLLLQLMRAAMTPCVCI